MLQVGIIFFIKIFLRLRYRVELKGLSQIKRDPKKALVILSNHPAEIDPVLLMTWLYPHFKQRPLVIEKYYYVKGFAWLMRYIKAIPIPDLKVKPTSWSLYKTQKQVQKVVTLCKEKEALLIYPAGIVKVASKESLGAAAIGYELVQSGTPIQFVLARITGLWGSSFSRYLNGKMPDFHKTLFKGILTAFINLLFLIPKRKVLIEVQEVGQDDLQKLDKSALNRYLEDWYNQYPSQDGRILDTEPLISVPYYFFWRVQQRISAWRPKKAAALVKTVPLEFRNDVDAFLLTLTKREKIDWTSDTQLGRDLNLDSLELAELWIFLSKKYNLTGLETEELITVDDVYQVAIHAREERIEEQWTTKQKLSSCLPGLLPHYDENASTLLEVFYAAAVRRKSQAICVDYLTGVLTYSKLVRAVSLLSQEIKAIGWAESKNGQEREYIGVLLPSSVGAYIIILSILLSGKVPVMLNWTLGKAHLEECVANGKFKTIISSEKFLLELVHADLGLICDSITLIEDLRKQIGFKKIIRLLCKGAFAQFQEDLKAINLKPDDVAVILFTSGTEGAAKMVPLTHENIVTNQRASMKRITLQVSDLFYAMLPPFHSFGFAVTGLLPLLAGLRVYYEPNPTESLKIAKEILRESVTILCSPPSFLRGILAELDPRDPELRLRLVVSGAEALYENLFDRISKFSFDFIEGYGITECSPIVSLQTPGEKASTFKKYLEKGVGSPLEGIEIQIIDRETLKPLPEGEEGEICVFGKSVFQGYPDPKSQHCFIEIQGKRFYRTGDRGKMNHEILILTGRYKRFVKIGGEMIHLGTIERFLLESLKKIGPGDLPSLAVIGIEGAGHKTQIFVFTTEKVEKAVLQEALRSRGLSPLFKIDQVVFIQSIPLTGTGKIDYLYLEKSAKTK